MVVNFNAALEVTCRQIQPEEARMLKKIASAWNEDEKLECLNRYLEMRKLTPEAICTIQRAYAGLPWD